MGSGCGQLKDCVEGEMDACMRGIGSERKWMYAVEGLCRWEMMYMYIHVVEGLGWMVKKDTSPLFGSELVMVTMLLGRGVWSRFGEGDYGFGSDRVDCYHPKRMTSSSSTF